MSLSTPGKSVAKKITNPYFEGRPKAKRARRFVDLGIGDIRALLRYVLMEIYIEGLYSSHPHK